MGEQKDPISKEIKEWIIFSLSLGFCGHIALGLTLHAPQSFLLTSPWTNGILIVVFFYLMVQSTRLIFRFWRN